MRLARGGQTVSSVAKSLGLSDQTLHNWLKAELAGGLCALTGKAVSAGQMEIARLNDRCRTRKDFSPLNLAIVRHMVVNIRKREKSKLSLERNCLKAAVNPAFRAASCAALGKKALPPAANRASPVKPSAPNKPCHFRIVAASGGKAPATFAQLQPA